MPENALSIVIGMPEMAWNAVGIEGVERILSPHPNVKVSRTSDPERFAELALHADAVFSFNFHVPAEALRPGTRLRWVHSVPAGIDGLVTPELMAADHVTLTASKGPHAPLIAEHMVLLMLSLARHMPSIIRDQSERVWPTDNSNIPQQTSIQLLGKTIAILGVGQIGQCLARICQVGFGMRVLGMSRTTRGCQYVDEYFERSELHSVLGEADVVAICMSLTPDTAKIIGKAELEAMKPTALLINAARGGLVDEAALIDAMNSDIIGGAALDTVDVEPLPESSPLWDLPNTIISPHCSARTDNLGNEITGFWVENIRRFAENEPMLGLVDRKEGY